MTSPCFVKWNSPHPYFAESATVMSAFTVNPPPSSTKENSRRVSPSK